MGWARLHRGVLLWHFLTLVSDGSMDQLVELIQVRKCSRTPISNSFKAAVKFLF